MLMILLFHDKSDQSESSIKSPEDFMIERVDYTRHDPYNEAMLTYLGDQIEEHERLKEILIKLNPRDYVDWDDVDFKGINSESSSS